MSHFIGLPLSLDILPLARATWRVARALRFIEGPIIVRVPVGWVTDLTSIPFYLPIRKEGLHTPASVIHDVLYAKAQVTYDMGDGSTVEQAISRKQADQIYRRAMRALSVAPWRIRLIYCGVRAGGWWAWRRYRKGKR